MEKVKVSIVIPVYNSSKYLDKCINSIINQSYSNIEVVLIDDGSKDDSGSICDNYAKKDNRVHVYHQKNSGVSTARNNGISKANGDYVTFIDSDDFVHQDYIQKLVDNLKSDSLSVCQIENYYGRDIVENKDDKNIVLNKNQFIELCTMYLLNTPCCKLYNLDIIKKSKILFDTKLSLGEDLLFNLDYLKNVNGIVITNRKLYYYRKDDNNTLSTAYNPDMLNIQLLLFDKYTDFFENTKMNNNELRIFDSYRLSTLKIIIENEFRNKKISFYKRYINAKRIVSNKEFRSRIDSILYPEKKLLYFLIRHKLILVYKVINKITNVV